MPPNKKIISSRSHFDSNIQHPPFLLLPRARPRSILSKIWAMGFRILMKTYLPFFLMMSRKIEHDEMNSDCRVCFLKLEKVWHKNQETGENPQLRRWYRWNHFRDACVSLFSNIRTDLLFNNMAWRGYTQECWAAGSIIFYGQRGGHPRPSPSSTWNMEKTLPVAILLKFYRRLRNIVTSQKVRVISR